MWEWLKRFVRDSETLAWARIQMALGALAAIATYVDPVLVTAAIPAEWAPWFILANGIATEYLRRRRATDL